MRVLLLSVFYWLLGWVLVGATGSAQARDTVLLLEAELLRPDLCVALRIQLTDLADVRCLTRPTGRDLATRIADASQSVASEPARLAVLLERDPDARYIRMVLVGQPDDRAVLAIESIEDRAAPDVDRSLALKVRDTLEVLDASRAGGKMASSTVQPAGTLAAVLAPPTDLRRAASPAPLRGVVELGGALGTSGAARGAGVVALGLRARREAAYGELALAAQLASGLDHKSPVGHVEEDEWGLSLSVRVGRAWVPFSLGGLMELGVLRVHARGFTLDDSNGPSTRALARVGMGLDLRIVVLRAPTRVVLRLAPTLQVDPQRQRFALDQQPALDLGRVHAWVPLTLLFELPLQHSEAGDDA